MKQRRVTGLTHCSLLNCVLLVYEVSTVSSNTVFESWTTLLLFNIDNNTDAYDDDNTGIPWLFFHPKPDEL